MLLERLGSRCAITLLSLLSTSNGHCAEGIIVSHIETYNIEGQSVDDLRVAIIDATRSQRGGSHGAASATFKFTPQLNYREIDQSCILTDVKVRLDITIVLPEWISSHGADEATVASWRRFERYLRAHEERHAAIAAGFRETMVEELQAIGVMTDCPTLGREVVAVVGEVERQHDEAQNAFDRRERGRSALLSR